jgi:hypothetical protein
MREFREVTVGGVLFAPFVFYALAALGLLFALRPALRGLSIDRHFANPPVAVLSLYFIVLAALIVLF